MYGADYVKHKYETFYKNKSLLLDLSDVVSRERAEDSSSLRSSNEPSIITFLHDIDNVSLQELHLILVLRLVVVKSPVAVKQGIVIIKKRQGLKLTGLVPASR